MIYLVVIVLAIVFLLIVARTNKLANVVKEQRRMISEKTDRIRQLDSELRSKSVLYGNFLESFFPLVKNLYDDADVVGINFLGQPIDYIVFRGDVIEFVEIKTGRSKLSKVQRNIRDLVRDGKVKFMEVRLDK